MVGVGVGASPIQAAPSLLSPGQVGALPPDPAVATPPGLSLPVARQRPGHCAFDFDSPPPVPVRHVARCGDAVDGTGAPDRPWGTLRQAMLAATAGQTVYVHDDPGQDVDYREYDLTPGNAGSSPNRIRFMGAPGEARPTVAKPGTAPLAKPVLRLTQPWWMVEGLRVLGTRVEHSAAILATGSYLVLRRLEVTDAGTANAAVTISRGHDVALLDSHIHEALTGDAVTGRPTRVPTDSRDNQGVVVYDGADRVLLRGNDSYGHNGDSAQCGEDPGSAPTNLTVDGNRFHQDEENAVDLKHCLGVTVRNNKFYGYYPARPLSSRRSPQGDAIVVHHDQSGDGADRILIERNRFFRNSRSINLSPEVGSAVVRRNLIFDARTDQCGIGAGIRAAARVVEIYHNTLDRLPTPAAQPGTDCPVWQESERAAIRINSDGVTQRAVLWNNIIARAHRHLQITAPRNPLDAANNLFDRAPVGGTPPGSLVGDPMFVDDPAYNDFYTEPGSPAQDHAAAVPVAVGDPVTYCRDGNPPDIGFLESC
jgi:hypothetical protein